MAQKCGNALFANTLDALQARQKEVLATTVAVVGDTKAVGLIANMTDDLQRLACATQIVRHRVVGIEYLRQAVMQVYNTDDFSYTWMEDKIASIYSEDRKIATTYSVFALIAIIVSCLGLFGIALFDIRQRYREIAIRKVNGAGMKDLYHLLFKKYLTVLGASFVVAVPVAYYLIHQYTADFVVKAPIGASIFVLALLLVAIISMGTLWWQIRKAANINPAMVMKRE